MLPFIFTIVSLLRAGFSALKDKEFRALAFLLFVLLAMGSVFYHEVEHWRWLDSLYFSVITLTTVGYGDITPHTDAGKIFTMIYIFLGLGVILGFIETLAEHARKQEMRILPRRGGFVRVSQILSDKGQTLFKRRNADEAIPAERNELR